jgi:hypothetical protein
MFQYTVFEISYSSNLSLYILFDGLRDTLFGLLDQNDPHNLLGFGIVTDS